MDHTIDLAYLETNDRPITDCRQALHVDTTCFYRVAECSDTEYREAVALHLNTTYNLTGSWKVDA